MQHNKGRLFSRIGGAPPCSAPITSPGTPELIEEIAIHHLLV
jgi:hypothetical protein